MSDEIDFDEYAARIKADTARRSAEATEASKPGMEAVTRLIYDGSRKSQAAVCYDIANEIWIRINTIERDARQPASKRMSRTARDRYLIEMSGLKVALRLALGVSYTYAESNVDAFLNAFQQERRAASSEGGNNS